MNDHRTILHRVGLVLVVIGALDIGWMIYCIANEVNYSSSFNIFAVIAGVFLLRGHLGAAKIVTWFSAFLLSGFVVGSLTLFPQLQPLDYWLVLLRKDPGGSLMSIALVIVVLGMLFWIYTQLRQAPVVAARVAAGQKAGAPLSAFLTGSALVLALTVVMHLTIEGEMGEKAVRLATEQNGPNYKYFVSSMNWGNSHVSAHLIAYNDREVKEVSVEWED
jgi:hypothetical protein